MTTQKERLLDTLKLGPVCSFRFYDHPGLTHRIAARVWDLRQDGHIITSRACTLHDHESNAVLYELAETDQLSLL